MVFGYEVLDSENGSFQKDGKSSDARYLKELKVWEVPSASRSKSKYIYNRC